MFDGRQSGVGAAISIFSGNFENKRDEDGKRGYFGNFDQDGKRVSLRLNYAGISHK